MKPYKIVMFVLPVLMILGAYNVYERFINKPSLVTPENQIKMVDITSTSLVYANGGKTKGLTKNSIGDGYSAYVIPSAVSDGDLVTSHIKRMEFLNEFPSLIALLIPILVFIFFMFTPAYRILCWKIANIIVLQDPLPEHVSVTEKFQNLIYVKNPEFDEPLKRSHGNCVNCGANSWTSYSMCNYCGSTYK